MGVSKTNLFTEEQNDLAVIAKVFSHPARIAILEYLVQANACINSGLVAEIGLAQATVSQHLRELKNIGIIQGTIDGTSMSYCINHKRWTEVQALFNQLFNQQVNCSEGDCC